MERDNRRLPELIALVNVGDRLVEIYCSLAEEYEKYLQFVIKQGQGIKKGEYEDIFQYASKIQDLQAHIETQQQEVIEQYKLFNITPTNIKNYLSKEQYDQLEEVSDKISQIIKNTVTENDNNQRFVKEEMITTRKELKELNKGKEIAGAYTAKKQSIARMIDKNI